MNDTVISIENLSKKYHLGEIGTGTLSHDLNRWWANIRGKEDPNILIGIEKKINDSSSDQIMALCDFNLEIKRGDILGIIGKNGAGKSTLLKLISRITSPTTGIIKFKGRIASLLEVGTGMHPEMTARENIYLNGSILGMTKNEINKKFEEIIEFAGCAQFIDTPIKRFSSGMKVRLGFAVAAYLESDIMIIDEVLAVGDAEFQQKCIKKIEGISDQGRTVIFVSHNMASIEKICSRCVLIDKGEKKLDATPKEAISAYYNSNNLSRDISANLLDSSNRGKSSIKLFKKIVLKNERDQTINKLRIGEYLKIIVGLKENIKLDDVSFGIGVENEMGERLFSLSSLMCKGKLIKINTSVTNEIEFILKKVNLMPGKYSISLAAVKSQIEWVDSIERAILFEIIPSDIYGTGKLPTRQQGSVYMPAEINIV